MTLITLSGGDEASGVAEATDPCGGRGSLKIPMFLIGV